jgi:hypothetical protein
MNYLKLFESFIEDDTFTQLRKIAKSYISKNYFDIENEEDLMGDYKIEIHSKDLGNKIILLYRDDNFAGQIEIDTKNDNAFLVSYGFEDLNENYKTKSEIVRC